jgi:hypothetical protein
MLGLFECECAGKALRMAVGLMEEAKTDFADVSIQALSSTHLVFLTYLPAEERCNNMCMLNISMLKSMGALLKNG